MSARGVIVALATAWGPRFGGINAFNTEMVKSLGILPERDYDLFCVVPGTETQEQIDECRRRFGVELHCIDGTAEIVRVLGATSQPERFLWIGHDDKTGPLALELRALAPGSRALLINHMAHGAYQSVKKGSSATAADRERAQRELFRQADLCFAVGPMLRSHLNDLLGSLPKRPPVEMLVPGLADPTEHDVEIRDAPPENYVAFVAGRLDAEDDRIKQGRLALRAFGNAVVRAGEHSAIRRSPKLRMRGVRKAEEDSLLRLLTNEARGAVAFDFQDYTEVREAYFRDLASASVAMMPSWHEGFGLTAWEAIASAVPVIVSEQSGVYRLLDDECSGAGLGHSVAAVQIAGYVPASEDERNHTEDDVVRVADALLDFGERAIAAKQEALTLRRNLLALGYDWKGCAVAFTRAAEKQLGVRLTAARREAHLPPAAAGIPVDLTVPAPLRVPAPRRWHREAGLPTSMLLVARDEVVRFDQEREPILGRMLEWTSSGSPLAARLLFGPGGMGKTRLALELARRAQRAGWLALWIPATPPPDWVTVLHQRAHRPALVIIDYADARPAAALEALDAALQSIRAGNASPIRLLLLARSESWLGTLHRHPGCSQDVAAWLSSVTAVEPVRLPPWSSDEAIRLASYQAALEDYAVATGSPSPPNAYVPRLHDTVFDRPLYLHLAALAALEGQRPEGADALLRNQLQREWRYWCGIHGEQLATYDEWADALAYVILRQGAAVSELPPRLGAALHRSYPAGEDRVASLEPDLLAEALLRERLAGRRGAELLDSAFNAASGQPPDLAVVGRLAAHARAFRDGELPPAWAAALISGIARHWPRHPNEWLTAAHRGELGLGDMLHAAWQQLDPSERESMAKVLALPDYSTNLIQLRVAVCRQRLKDATDPIWQGAELNDLSVALSDVGDAASRTEALTCVEQATQIYRDVVKSQPAFLPILGTSLNNLSNRLREQGDAGLRGRAIETARESIAIYRQLAANEPETYRANLGRMLSNLSIHLAELGGPSSRAEAFASGEEAVRIFRTLAEADPHEHLPYLAMALNNFALRLAEQNDASSRARALSTAREASRIYRGLAEMLPAAYLPSFAMSLSNLAFDLSQLGNAPAVAEALSYAREAVQIHRRLAATAPDRYLIDLGMSLNTLAACLIRQGDASSRSEALEHSRAAVQIYAQLHAWIPAAVEDRLKIAIFNMRHIAIANGKDPGQEVQAALSGRLSLTI